MMEARFRDGGRIEIFHDATRITMPDGAIIMAAPEATDIYRATAANNGYGDDTMLLCQEHELMHLAVADWLGAISPTMHHVAYGTHESMDLRGLEEDAVLALQKYARALRIDLVARLAAKAA